MATPPQKQPSANDPPTSTDMLYYESRRGENWSHQEVKILTEWIHISATFLDILSEACESYRKTIRANTIVNLVVSTLASTLSVGTFNVSAESSPATALSLKIVFTIMTMMLTIAAGYIKVYQIQEKLENSLRLKNEWALFGSKISSEMQLPLMLRPNGIALVNKMKDTYLQLVQSDLGIRKDIIKRMAARSGLTTDDLTLSEIFERIASDEVNRLHDDITIRADCQSVEEPPLPYEQPPVPQPVHAENHVESMFKGMLGRKAAPSLRSSPIKDRARIASFIQKPASSMSKSASRSSESASTAIVIHTSEEAPATVRRASVVSGGTTGSMDSACDSDGASQIVVD